MAPAVFLDRDGVINRDRLDYVKSWEEFEFLPNSLEGLRALAQTPYAIVIISNQSGIGRGLLSEDTLQEMHHRMMDRIHAAGGRIDAIYYCPHVPEAGCTCRKPAAGLFFQAARELDLDLAASWAIGDSYRDAEAANRAGAQSILLNRSLPDHSAIPAVPIQARRTVDLLSAVKLVTEIDRSFTRPA